MDLNDTEIVYVWAGDTYAELYSTPSDIWSIENGLFTLGNTYMKPYKISDIEIDDDTVYFSIGKEWEKVDYYVMVTRNWWDKWQ